MVQNNEYRCNCNEEKINKPAVKTQQVQSNEYKKCAEYYQSKKNKKAFRDFFCKFIDFMHEYFLPPSDGFVFLRIILNIFISLIIIIGIFSKSYSLLTGEGFWPLTFIEGLALFLITYIEYTLVLYGHLPDGAEIPSIVIVICIFVMPVLHFLFPEVVVQFIEYIKNIRVSFARL